MYYKIINKKKRIAVIIADLLGYALWATVNIFKKNEPISADIREILVIRTAYIGDVVMTLPILKPLKKLYPHAKITFLTSSAAKGLFLNNQYADSVITYNAFWFYSEGRLKDFFGFLKTLRSKHYDLIIEARGDIRDIFLLMYLSRGRYRVSYNVGGGGFLLTHVVPFEGIKHRVDYHLDIISFLGGGSDATDWGLHPTKEENHKAEEIILKYAKRQGSVIIGIHPGGRKGLKCWPMERYAGLADRAISELGAKIFFTGSEKEYDLVKEITMKMNNRAENLAGSLDLKTLSAFIGKLDVFITNDSAPLHIASAMKTPTIAIFGPSKSNETGPYGNIHRVVEEDFSCRAACDEDVCNHKVFNECMEGIAVEDVFFAVKEILSEIKNKKRASYGIQG